MMRRCDGMAPSVDTSMLWTLAVNEGAWALLLAGTADVWSDFLEKMPIVQASLAAYKCALLHDTQFSSSSSSIPVSTARS